MGEGRKEMSVAELQKKMELVLQELKSFLSGLNF